MCLSHLCNIISLCECFRLALWLVRQSCSCPSCHISTTTDVLVFFDSVYCVVFFRCEVNCCTCNGRTRRSREAKQKKRNIFFNSFRFVEPSHYFNRTVFCNWMTIESVINLLVVFPLNKNSIILLNGILNLVNALNSNTTHWIQARTRICKYWSIPTNDYWWYNYNIESTRLSVIAYDAIRNICFQPIRCLFRLYNWMV